jgi:TonB family protein
MMSKWKSLSISAGGHAAILVLSIIISLFAHTRSFRQEPIRVDLLAPGPIGGTPDGGGSEKKTTPPVKDKKDAPKTKAIEPPKIEKKDTKPVVTKKPDPVKPTYDPKADVASLEKFLKDHKLKPAEDATPPVETSKFSGTASGSGRNYGKGGVYGGGSTYDGLIQQIIRNNWKEPGRAIVGPNPPVLLATITVDRNGNIIASRITQSSGIQQFDESALKAIEDSDPLPRLPAYITGTQRDFELRFIVED